MLERVRQRGGHYMPPSLVASQFATLERPEAPENVLAVDATQPVEAIVDEILNGLADSER